MAAISGFPDSPGQKRKGTLILAKSKTVTVSNFKEGFSIF